MAYKILREYLSDFMAAGRAGATETRVWKMREWINLDQAAGLENARQASMDSQKSN